MGRSSTSSSAAPADNLDGREGDDSLLGGAGADIFTFTGVTGNDRILDFVSGSDRIDFSAFGIAATNVVATASGADTLLGVDPTLDGVVDFQVTLVGAGAPLPTDYIF